jgi:hypothetical protein
LITQAMWKAMEQRRFDANGGGKGGKRPRRQSIATVRRIHELIDAGLTDTEIAERLNIHAQAVNYRRNKLRGL